MSNSTMDSICGGTLLIFLVGYGIWLSMNAWRQLRNPTSIHSLGISWFTNLVIAFASEENRDNLDNYLHLESTIRSVARYALIAGFLFIMAPIIAIILVYGLLE